MTPGSGRVPGWPGSATQVAAVIGDPVEHSLSPVLHNAAFAALGLDWVYVAFPVATGHVGAAMAGARALGLAGLSVTMPHKAAAAAEMDALSPTATRLGVVNTVTRRGYTLVGGSTDGDGFLAALRADFGWEPAGRACVVLGNGGAARAVILALADAGAAEVLVVARKAESAQAAAELAGPVGQVASIDAVAGAALVVNATPVGMSGHGTGPDLPLGLDSTRLGSGQLVVDLIYAPARTPLLDAAATAGARVGNGLGTLVHQAGFQFRLWTGMEPPLDVMLAAGEAALAARGSPTVTGLELTAER
jgi:shikimate dehydrogenase